MKRSVYPACLLPLLLAACASESAGPPPADTKPSSLAEPAGAPSMPLGGEDLRPWLGRWVVTEAYGSAQSGQRPRPPVGQRLELGEAVATDLDGRTCVAPSFRGDGASEAAFLGLDKSTAESLRQIRPRLSVTCGPAAFGQYLAVRDGSLLAHVGGGTLRLARQADAPAPEQSVKESSAVEPPPARSEGDAPSPRAVYLASYRDQDTALTGWKELAKISPLLQKATPELTPVTLPGRGKFLRLWAKGLSDVDGAKLCKALIRMLPDCGARDRR
ncbi:hypothetical protein [Telmatospirillum siberiense]|uniref:SPOR domain-containing protein n=1 Tax=Telmatospirillum siberiense TaxID=382514 RepID=A0A2N3PW91_9PROT|nr:hypothetical protein [Telmatospirillum siberiense]PKU24672.1 hypothetical protein CWS72_10025 [Telmatospirillum siberiense]